MITVIFKLYESEHAGADFGPLSHESEEKGERTDFCMSHDFSYMSFRYTCIVS